MSTEDTPKTAEAKPVRRAVILQVVTFAGGILEEMRRRGDQTRETVSCRDEDVSGVQTLGVHHVLLDLSELARDLDILHYTGSGLAMGGRDGNKPIVTYGFTNVLSDEDVLVNMRKDESVPVNIQFESLYNQSWVATAAFVWDNPEGSPDAIICDGMSLYKDEPGTAVIRLRYVDGETFIESQVHFQGTSRQRQIHWNQNMTWERIASEEDGQPRDVSKLAMAYHRSMNARLHQERQRQERATRLRW